MNKLINGDCLQYLESMGNVQAIIADPPDNLGLSYNGFADNNPCYYQWLSKLMSISVQKSNHFWICYYHRHDLAVSALAQDLVRWHNLDWHKYLWTFTFGQHRESDCGNGYRPILRLSKPGCPLYTSSIRVPSDRQTLYNDPRANPDGRVPSDVWAFPRVVGNSHERRSWHPTQVNGAIYSRILRMSTHHYDTVVDPFLGTGTLFRANNQYKAEDRRNAVGIEISAEYCKQISQEHNLEIQNV